MRKCGVFAHKPVFLSHLRQSEVFCMGILFTQTRFETLFVSSQRLSDVKKCVQLVGQTIALEVEG